jgi:hypothetical protein
MRLLIKFNLLLLIVFAVGIAITGYVAHSFLQESAIEDVVQHARLMMAAAGGMRTYTSKQVDPLLAAQAGESKNFAPSVFRPTRLRKYSTISARITPPIPIKRRR